MKTAIIYVIIVLFSVTPFVQGNCQVKKTSDQNAGTIYSIKGKISNKSELSNFLTKNSCVQLVAIPKDTLIQDNQVYSFNAGSNPTGDIQLTSTKAKGLIGADGSFTIKMKTLPKGKFLLAVQDLDISSSKKFNFQASYNVNKSLLDSECNGIKYIIVVLTSDATGKCIIINPQKNNSIINLGSVKACSLEGTMKGWVGSGGGYLHF